MTDFESNNLHPAASLDHLSLKNWTLPQKENEKSEKPEGEKSEKSPASEKANEEEGIISLVPRFVRVACKNPKTAELRVSYDAPTAQYTYTYCISWEDEEDGSAEKLIKLLQAAQAKSTTTSESTSQSTSESETTSGSESVETSMKKTSSVFLAPPLAPVDTKCDGPCKKVFPSNLLSTIGRCGHYLCTACYGIVKNSDGTNGCSSATCFWRGASREESKKNYDEDVRRKQRAKAKEMIRIGIDVKPASRANSEIGQSSTITSSSKSLDPSKTNMSSLIRSPMASAPSTLIPSVTKLPPKGETPMRAHLIIVEPSKQYGMTHSYCNQKFRSDANLLVALKSMLVKKHRKVDDYIPAGKLYYGMIRGPAKFGMRRIKADKVSSIIVGDIPKLGRRLVLIMDMGDYVTKGVKIYLE